jgi:hypothetical protein
MFGLSFHFGKAKRGRGEKKERYPALKNLSVRGKSVGTRGWAFARPFWPVM